MKSVRALTLALAFLQATWAAAAGSTTAALSTERIAAEESSFGDLAADALCDAAATTIALAPAAAFERGREIAPGEVTLEAVSDLLRSPGERWAVLDLTGGQIRRALERAVSFAPTPRAFFLQVSGLKLVYNPDAPRSRKIRSLKVGFAEIDETAKYEVAMPEGLAAESAGYLTVFGGAAKVRSGTRGLATIITDYVDAKESVSYTGQGRILVGEQTPR